MNGEKAILPPTQAQIERYFEQSPAAISFYCDFGQVIGTDNEVVLQFYETIPGTPDREGKITKVLSRLRATITFSIPHAQAFGKVLIARTEEGKK
jgi:hypothetical protein